MKPTFLDYLTEVTAADWVKLNKATAPGKEALPKELMQWLYNQGYYLVDKDKFHPESVEFREIGSGSVASVFVKNDDDKYVLKVARKPDPCWVKFVKLARASRNPHFPKVISLREWKVTDDTWRKDDPPPSTPYFLATVERLWPLQLVEVFETEQLSMLAALAVMSGHANEWIIHTINDTTGNSHTQADIFEEGKKLLDSKHPFAEAYRQIENLGCDLDMHPYNMMVREPEGTMVFSDPIR